MKIWTRNNEMNKLELFSDRDYLRHLVAIGLVRTKVDTNPLHYSNHHWFSFLCHPFYLGKNKMIKRDNKWLNLICKDNSNIDT